MNTYLLLLRGINVGGKNRIPMADLKACLEARGFTNVVTYIASGNVIADTPSKASDVQSDVEKSLTANFKLDSELIKVLVVTQKQLQEVVDNKPRGFGEQPELYYSDAIFLMDVSLEDVAPLFNPREGVDKIWPGNNMFYSQRLGSERTKSRLSDITKSPLYKSLTIRSWNTTVKLLDIMNSR